MPRAHRPVPPAGIARAAAAAGAIAAIVAAAATAAPACSSRAACDAAAGVCAGADAAARCTTSADCAPPTPACDVAAGVCAACTPDDDAACSGSAPVCGDDRTCRACRAHAECESRACLPSGACADPAEVAYVAPAGADARCLRDAPCGAVAAALATLRPYIKITGTLDEAVAIQDRAVALLADPGARLTRSTLGAVLELRGASDVAIYDLEISGGLGRSGAGVSLPAGGAPRVRLERARVVGNTGGGVVAAAGTVIARRSLFRGNAAGGLSLSSAQFDLENNVISQNGNFESSFGGILIGQLPAGTKRIELNTITANDGAPGAVTGVLCALVGPTAAFASNIVYANRSGGTGPQPQVSGASCVHTYSIIGPGGAPGEGNADLDPLFQHPDRSDYHLQSDSPAIDRASPAALVTEDFDGAPRPQGPRCDIGAFERSPQ